MTNAEIKAYSLDGFKDGFEAATNRLAERISKKYRQEFLKDMAEIQEMELQRAAKIWDITFLEIATATKG